MYIMGDKRNQLYIVYFSSPQRHPSISFGPKLHLPGSPAS